MLKTIKSVAFVASAVLLLGGASCKKGTFDINNTNPNVPSNVDPKFILSGTLKNSAALVAGGDQDVADIYMGYYAVSGDYIPSYQTETYQTNTDYYSDNWNSAYLILKNYQQIIDLSSSDPNKAYYVGIAKIMQGFHLFRLVDAYNNVPNSQALQGGTINFPAYDPALSVYTSAFNKIDSGIAIIKAAPATVEAPGNFDIMFDQPGLSTAPTVGQEMADWILFANTVKLRAAVTLSKSSSLSLAQKELTGLTSSSFLPAGMDATINPGYSNASEAQQSPIYNDMGFSTSGSVQNDGGYYVACSYLVNFLVNNNDPRAGLEFAYATAYLPKDTVTGRPFGSTAAAGQDNQHISQLGPGILGTPSSSAMILPATESFFLQADAELEGLLPGGTAAAQASYQTAVSESFRVLGDANYIADAAAYTSQADPATNFDLATTPAEQLTLVVTQEWAALPGLDPFLAWNNWRRLDIPASLPVSIYPGDVAPHVPYRLLYPTSEFNYNSTNVAAQGTINNITSKIFWMPN